MKKLPVGVKIKNVPVDTFQLIRGKGGVELQRIRRFLVLTLLVCFGMTLPGIVSNAEDMSGEQTSAGSGLEDENPQRLQEVTAMDEEGNIFEVDEEGGELADEGIEPYSRGISVKVVNFRTKGNAVTDYTEYYTGQAGYTNGAFGADAAYLGTNGSKVRFMLSGVVGEVEAKEVQVVDFSNAQSISYYAVEGGRLRHYITQDMTAAKHATSLDNGSAPSYLQAGVEYYSYDGHYFYTDYGTMLEDYQKETRACSVNPGDPYYNYYQYLPFRSKTSYDGAKLNQLLGQKTDGTSKLNNTGDYFTNSQNTYGVNALIMTGIAANESAWGTSSICQNKNNLFGLNAVDSSPGTSANTYASVEECIRQFADGWMSRKYLNPKGWTYRGGFLGNKASGVNVKYASDPYWGEKAANIIWLLDQNGGSQDAYAYTIGIKDTLATGHTSVNVRNGSSQSSVSLYKTGTPSNYAVLIQDTAAENGYYRIQSDAVLTGDRSGINTGTGEYQFEQMFAYIHSDYAAVVSQGNTVAAKKELKSVTISQAPAKTAYTAGEVFEPAGMVVTADYSDGSSEDVTASITYSQEPLTAGTGSITVTYTYEGTAMSAEQAITVSDSAAKPDEGTTPEPTPTPDEGTTPEPTPTPTPTPEEGPEPAPTPEEGPTSEPTPDEVQTPEPEPIQGVDTGNTPDAEPTPEPGEEQAEASESIQGAGTGNTPKPAPKVNTEPQPVPSAAGDSNLTLASDSVENEASEGTPKETSPTPASSPKTEQKPTESSSVRRAPVTGDESEAMLWGALLAVSLLGMLSIHLYSKKSLVRSKRRIK